MKIRAVSLCLLTLLCGLLFGVNAVAMPMDSIMKNDSINQVLLHNLRLRLAEMDSIRLADSLQRATLEQQLATLQSTEDEQKATLQKRLEELQQKEVLYRKNKVTHLDSLRRNAIGYPVLGLVNDTIFTLYMRVGAYGPAERAINISERVRAIYEDGFSPNDSLVVSYDHDFADIVYKDQVVMAVTETEAIWHDTTMVQLASDYRDDIYNALLKAHDEYSTTRTLKRIGLVLVAIVGLFILIRLVNMLIKSLKKLIFWKKDKWLKDLRYKDYTIISKTQELKLISRFINFLRIVLVVLLFLVVIPTIFSIFPFSRDWSDKVFALILKPIKDFGTAIWNYLPNLLTIVILFFVMKLVIKITKYFFLEIEHEKLKIPGFHPDFAQPTNTIIKILIYAFFMILIFPYLPGSGSPAFNGISVFIGILVSLGSSSAIANMIAGIVITYMRPFKVGDRIKIETVVGDVLEKNLLVTRIKTIKNEEITIPNSKVLTAATMNYSSLAETKGLILHVEISIGYDVPWKKVEDALIEAMNRCPSILEAPKPFVLKTQLDDFYVVYSANGYVTEASKQALIYTEMMSYILDVFREEDIEILSPHYRAYRDGNESTIPPEYNSPKTEKKEPPILRGEQKESQEHE